MTATNKTAARRSSSSLTIEALQAQAHSLAQRGLELAIDAEKLESQIRLARGTREIEPMTLAEAESIPVAVNDKPSDQVRADGESSTRDVINQVRTMLEARPCTFRELKEACQVSDNRLKGVIVQLQRAEIGLLNLGSPARASWYVPSASTRKALRGK